MSWAPIPSRRGRGWGRWSGRSKAVLLVATPFLAGGAAGLLQDKPLLALSLLLFGAIIVSVERLSTLAQGRTQQAADEALRGTRGGGAVKPVGVSNLPALTRLFTGREPELTELTRLLRGMGRVAVVAAHGLGGVGKSQLALAYAHRHETDFPVRWWIRATSRLTIVADLAALAAELGLEVEADQEQTAERVIKALTRRSGWLLIYDDAQHPNDLDGLLPRAGAEAGQGQVLVSSRNPNFDTVAATVQVDPLPDLDAVEFLLARTGSDATKPAVRSAAEELAKMLGGLPLALEQAAAYCMATGIGLHDYLDRYRRGEGRLLAAGTPSSYPVPVAVTWLLNMRQAARADAAAVQLLRLLAFVAPGAVPRDLPATAPGLLPDALGAAARDPVRLDRAVGVLRGMSLVTVDQPGQLRIHQLVQQVVRDRLQRDTRSWLRRLARSVLGRLGWRGLIGLDPTAGWPPRRWTAVTVRLLAEGFEIGGHTTDWWDRCQALLPHALAVLTYADQLHADPAMTAGLRHALAYYLDDRGEYAAARELLEVAIRTRRRVLGPEHLETLASMNNLAQVLQEQGELDAARQLYEQTLEVRRRTLGPEHPATL